MNLHDALLAKNILGGGGVPQSQIDEIATAIGLDTPSDVETILDELDIIIEDANETTGESDSSIIDATDRLIDGYRVVENLTVIENGTYTPDDGKAFGVVDVNIPSSGGSVTSGVKFIDYDGTVVETWDASSVAGKTALPTNPTHTGLTAQGWNWSLASIKSYIAKSPNAIVLVGQMYKTASGLTEIDITVTKVTGKTVTCKMSGNKNWGDGTTDALTEHTYSDYGNYTITCNGTSIPNGGSSFGGLFGSTSSNNNRYWCTAIRIGENVTSVGNGAFSNCYSLASITIPDSITSFVDGNAFYSCYSLASITIPDSVTSIENYAFYSCYSLTSISLPDGITFIGTSTLNSCYSLTSITIPDSVTSIDSNAFNRCYSLTGIIIPDGVTSIGSSAFQNCYSIMSYDFSSFTSVPTLYNVNAFTGINGLCKIIVPDALYDTWIVATNWSTYANYIYKASEVA